MRVISLDPSLRHFGVYINRDGETKSMVIEMEGDRVKTLGRLLSRFSHISAEGWDLCIVEGYAMGARGNAGTVLAEVGGIVRGLFAARGVPVLEVPNNVWKSVTGVWPKKGTTMGKSDYFNTISELYGVRFKTTDEGDAFLMYQAVKKCGSVAVGPGAVVIKRWLEDHRIKTEEM